MKDQKTSDIVHAIVHTEGQLTEVMVGFTALNHMGGQLTEAVTRLRALIPELIKRNEQLAAENVALNKAIEEAYPIQHLPTGTTPLEIEPEPIDTTPTIPALPTGTTKLDRLHVDLSGDMAILEVANHISSATPGTTFHVRGELPTVRIGGLAGHKPGKHSTVGHWNGTPVSDIEFVGEDDDAGFGGLLFHNSLGGYDGVHFENLRFRPRLDGDRAAIMCEEHYREDMEQGGLISFTNCEVWTPPTYSKWGGYGINQASIFRSSRVQMVGMHYSCVPKEHWVYNHNLMGDSVFRDISGETRKAWCDDGVEREIGPGRTLWSVQERRSDGLESYGDILVQNVHGALCGSESVIAGNKATGGSAFTVGGHNGQVTIRDCRVDKPMTGGVLAVWAERYTDWSLKGYREPSLESLELDGLQWSVGQGGHFSSRTPIKISNALRVKARDVGGIIDPWDSPSVKLNDSPSDSPLTRARVDWK